MVTVMLQYYLYCDQESSIYKMKAIGMLPVN